MLIRFVVLTLLSVSSWAADNDSMYINVGQANIKKSTLAIAPLRFLGTPTLASQHIKMEKDIYDVIEKDLTVSSFFTIQKDDPEKPIDKGGLRPAPIDPNGFDFSNWQNAGVEFLVKTGYNVIFDRIQLDTFVYNVKNHELLLGKSYTAPVKDTRSLAHKFCNDIVEKLTGKKGFFLTKLAVSKVTGPGKEIYIMDWDGANAIPVTKKQTISISPSWSPDGRYLAYSSYSYHSKKKMRNVDLFVYDFKTQKHNLLHSSKGLSSTLSFAPNMHYGVFRMSPNNGSSDLYKISLQEGTLTPLTQGPRGASNYEPSISPDGKTVAFSSDRGGRPMVYTIPIDGGPVQRLTFAGYYNASPVWSPDGKKIAFASAVSKHFEIFVMDSDGKNLQRLTSSKKSNGEPADSEDPSFSPDGRFIMFRSNRTGINQIYVVSIDGKNEYRLTFDHSSYERPQWSPYLQ